MGKKRFGPPEVVEILSGPAPTDFNTSLTPEQLAAGTKSLAVILQQAATNTTQREMLVAAADWVEGGYSEARQYLTSELCGELGGISSATLNSYAKLAGIRTPRRGERNYRYSSMERRQIYRHIIDASSDSQLVTICKQLLGNRK